eukprot:16753-Heterococcus_DN1.PRE.1
MHRARQGLGQCLRQVGDSACQGRSWSVLAATRGAPHRQALQQLKHARFAQDIRLLKSTQAGLSSRRGGSDGSDSKPAPPAGSMGRGTGSVAAFSEAHSGQLDKLQQEKRDLRRQQLQQTERRKAARDQTDSYEAEAADRISDSNPNIRPDGAGRTRTFTAARGSGSSGGRGPGRGGRGGGRDS